MNGNEVKKDGCSVAESVLRRFDELTGKARAIHSEAKVIARLVTGGDGERGNKTEPEEKRKAPDNILDFLQEKAEEIWAALIGINLNLDHLKEQVGTERFDRPTPHGRER